MCEKCKQLAERASAARETIIESRGEGAFRDVYEHAMCQTVNVKVPVALSNMIFPILQILLMEEHDNPITLAFAYAEMASDIREAVEGMDRFYPTGALAAKHTIDELCHNANTRMVEYLEERLYA